MAYAIVIKCLIIYYELAKGTLQEIVQFYVIEHKFQCSNRKRLPIACLQEIIYIGIGSKTRAWASNYLIWPLLSICLDQSRVERPNQITNVKIGKRCYVVFLFDFRTSTSDFMRLFRMLSFVINHSWYCKSRLCDIIFKNCREECILHGNSMPINT